MVLMAAESYEIEGKTGVALPPSVNGRLGVVDRVDVGLRGGMGGARLDVKVLALRSRFVDLALDPNASWGPYTTKRRPEGRSDELQWVHSHNFGLPALLGLNVLPELGLVGNAGVLYVEDRDALPFDDRLILTRGWAAHFGGGLSFRLGRKGHLQPEVSAIRFYDQPGDPWMFQIGLGIGFGSNPYRDAGITASPCPASSTSRHGKQQIIGVECNVR